MVHVGTGSEYAQYHFPLAPMLLHWIPEMSKTLGLPTCTFPIVGADVVPGTEQADHDILPPRMLIYHSP